jgi:hypothetical protein
MPAMPSKQAWNRLIQAQNKIESKEEAVLTKLLRLRKQKKLLRKCAGEFLSKNLKEVEELERLKKKK